jgi:hypothetical protein
MEIMCKLRCHLGREIVLGGSPPNYTIIFVYIEVHVKVFMLYFYDG